MNPSALPVCLFGCGICRGQKYSDAQIILNVAKDLPPAALERPSRSLPPAIAQPSTLTPPHEAATINRFVNTLASCSLAICSLSRLTRNGVRIVNHPGIFRVVQTKISLNYVTCRPDKGSPRTFLVVQAQDRCSPSLHPLLRCACAVPSPTGYKGCQ